MRLPFIATAAAAAATALVLALTGAGGDQGGYRVDADFDRLSGLVTDQDVRIAGAKVGRIVDIELTEERKARIGMEVDEGFAPFRADATCRIRQDSLLGEKFVQCDPGSPDAPELESRPDGPPTVRLERTEVPVDIDLILGMSRLPYRERLRILLTEFGVGLAGRGKELDAAIRRANPALREVEELLRTIGRDRAALRRLVSASDEALGELARRSDRVQSFIERADRATVAVASQRGPLDEAIRRLPPLLDELEPSAQRLASLAKEATPAMRELREAAPYITSLLGHLPAFADAGLLALDAIEETAPAGLRAAKSGTPLAKDLRAATGEMPDVVDTATELTESTRDSGGTESLLTFQYYAAASSARFDQISHFLPSYQLNSSCGSYSSTPVEGCSAKFAGAKAAKAPAGRAAAAEAAPEETLIDWLLAR